MTLLQFPKKLEILEDIKKATNDYEIILPKPYCEAQRLMMSGEFKSCVGILGTKTGKTLAASVRILAKSYTAHQEIGARYRIIAPVVQQALLTYQYMQRLIPNKLSYDMEKEDELNQRLMEIWADITPDRSDTRKLFEWKHNGAVINAVSGDNPDTIEGDRQQGVIIDEMAKVKEASIAASVSTTTQTGGWHLFVTTPTKGKNHAFRIYKEHEEKMNHELKMGRTPTQYAFRLPSWTSPYSDKEQIERARKTLPKRLFDMLYGAEFVDGSGVFNKVSEAFGNVTEYEYSDYFVKESHESKVIFVGVDFAKKVDYTVFYAINERGQNIGWWRMQNITYAEQVARMWRFCDRLKETCLLINPAFEGLYDETGVGGAVKEMIDMTMKYPFKGVIWNNSNKCDAVYKTISLFEQEKLSLIPWATLKNELEFFEAKDLASGRESFAASSGEHDDCVMSLIMCGLMLSEHQDANNLITSFSSAYEETLRSFINDLD